MSSIAVYETEISPEHIARDLNSDLQFVADHLLTDVKEAPVGEPFTLCPVVGEWLLWAEYLGQHRVETKQAQYQYLVRIGLYASLATVRLDLTEDFELTYQTLHDEGPLRAQKLITAEELARCPAPVLGSLALAVRSLPEAYERIHDSYLGCDAVIIPFPSDRVA